jgi:glycosyltransferase involved in cell wall biosynthesis
MHKVLIIAYTFPPMGGSGVQRTVKFAKYLPEFGWQPVILTVSNPPLREADTSLLEELPNDLPVYRTPDVNFPYLLRRIARGLGLISPNGQNSQQTGSAFSQPSSGAKSKLRATLSRFADVWLQIPDQFIYWLPGALWVGLKVVKQCDVIYSTSDPFTDHLVACFLHKLSGKPWVADFRDPWTQYVVYQRWSSRLRSRVDGFFEKYLLKVPNVVSVTCVATAKSFQELYPSLPKDKFVEITNGFDAEDFDRPICSDFDKFTIAYTGRFHGRKNTPHSFLQALGELRREQPELASEIQVVFAGMFEEKNYGLLKQWDLEGMVRPLGYVPHCKSIELLLKSHVLLLTLNDEPGVNLTYPGKLFEYLATRKTILALVPEGATADLIREMKAGPIVPPDDVEAVKKVILNLYNQYKQESTLSRIHDNLQNFERRTLTGRLAQCLDGLLRIVR